MNFELNVSGCYKEDKHKLKDKIKDKDRNRNKNSCDWCVY